MRDDTLMKEERNGTATGVLEYGNAGKVRWNGKSLEIGLFLLRLAVGGLMLFHGIAKARGAIEMIKPFVVAGGLPEWFVYGLYVAEIIAPIMIILGIWTRLAAGAIVIDMIMAIMLVHSHDMLSVSKGGGWAIELEAFYFLTALALIFTGGGMLRVKKSGSRWD